MTTSTLVVFLNTLVTKASDKLFNNKYKYGIFKK